MAQTYFSDPASYYGQREQGNTNRFNSILQMMMQSGQIKSEEAKYKEEMAMKKAQQGELSKYYDAQIKQMEKPDTWKEQAELQRSYQLEDIKTGVADREDKQRHDIALAQERGRQSRLTAGITSTDKKDPRVTMDENLVKNIRDRVNAKTRLLETDLHKSEPASMLRGPKLDQAQRSLAEYEKVKNILGLADNMLSEGIPLNKDIKKIIGLLNTNFGDIESGKLTPILTKEIERLHGNVKDRLASSHAENMATEAVKEKTMEIDQTLRAVEAGLMPEGAEGIMSPDGEVAYTIDGGRTWMKNELIKVPGLISSKGTSAGPDFKKVTYKWVPPKTQGGEGSWIEIK